MDSVNVSLDPRSKPILAIVPELDGSDSVRALLPTSSDNFLNAIIDAPSVKYAGQTIDSLQLRAASDSDRIKYTVTAARVGLAAIHLFSHRFMVM